MKVQIEDLEISYNGDPVLSGVNLELEGPGLVQVVGPNGSGKTTLLRAILGLIPPRRGRIYIDGVDVTGRPHAAGKLAGYVPQNPSAPKLSPMTVWEFISTGLKLRGIHNTSKVEEVLNIVGVPREAWDSRLWELSGGMLQRVFIARAISHDPRLLVMDEPLSSIDPQGRMGLARLIASLSRDRLVIMSSHDPNLLLSTTQTIIIVYHGVIAIGPPGEVFKKEVLESIYGATVRRGLVLSGEEGAHG